MLKGAPVSTEATAIPGASATTEVQNNSAEVQNHSASASDPVDAEASAMILIPLELWCKITRLLPSFNARCCPPLNSHLLLHLD